MSKVSNTQRHVSCCMWCFCLFSLNECVGALSHIQTQNENVEMKLSSNEAAA